VVIFVITEFLINFSDGSKIKDVVKMIYLHSSIINYAIKCDFISWRKFEEILILFLTWLLSRLP